MDNQLDTIQMSDTELVNKIYDHCFHETVYNCNGEIWLDKKEALFKIMRMINEARGKTKKQTK